MTAEEERFARWWHNEGMGLSIFTSVRRVARIAWLNGAFASRDNSTPASSANPDGEPAGKSDTLDFDVMFDPDRKEFHVWTPDETGAIIGIGKTEREALMNCVENLKLTIAAIQKPK